MRDLVCLVADKNMEAAIGGLLERPQALGIRPITYDLVVHPRHDPGCFHEGWRLLYGYRRTHLHGLMVLDLEWTGAPATTGPEMEAILAQRCEEEGLDGWAEAVVIEPELEVWVFNDSPHVGQILGWSGREPGLRRWLMETGLWPQDLAKPPAPKEVLERVLFATRKPRSSAIYRALAGCVSLERCRDRAFLRLKEILRGWYPAE